MSQMTQCEEGHYYDKSLNKNCPHCGLGASLAGGKAAGGGDEDDEKTIQADAEGRKGRREPRDSRKDDQEVTVAIWRKESGIDPVVGWLVCYEGPNQGRDYRICSGRNGIGRDTSSQICIRGDESISRENHAKIFYDTRNAEFHVTEGEGRSGVYVNNRVVLQPTRLAAYDVLEIGQTKLVFVPLCGDKFRWDAKKPAKTEEEPVRARESRKDPDDDYTKSI